MLPLASVCFNGLWHLVFEKTFVYKIKCREEPKAYSSSLSHSVCLSFCAYKYLNCNFSSVLFHCKPCYFHHYLSIPSRATKAPYHAINISSSSLDQNLHQLIKNTSLDCITRIRCYSTGCHVDNTFNLFPFIVVMILCISNEYIVKQLIPTGVTYWFMVRGLKGLHRQSHPNCQVSELCVFLPCLEEKVGLSTRWVFANVKWQGTVLTIKTST